MNPVAVHPEVYIPGAVIAQGFGSWITTALLFTAVAPLAGAALGAITALVTTVAMAALEFFVEEVIGWNNWHEGDMAFRGYVRICVYFFLAAIAAPFVINAAIYLGVATVTADVVLAILVPHIILSVFSFVLFF